MDKKTKTHAVAILKYWYVAQGASWMGPFTEAELMGLFQEGKICWADFVWSPTGGMKWCRLWDVAAFRSKLPAEPPLELIRKITATIGPALPAMEQTKFKTSLALQVAFVKPAVKKSQRAKAEIAPAVVAVPRASASGEVSNRKRTSWFLKFDGSEFGPLSRAEVYVILKSGKLKGALHAKSEGMNVWLPVEEISELQAMPDYPALSKNPTADERRRSRRVPLVATVSFNLPGDTSHGKGRYIGVCRDISATGLMVLSNRLPIRIDEPIQMEVTPLGASRLESFVSEVDVIRVLPKEKGFSVRFRSLSAEARVAIDAYLSRTE